MKDIFMIGNTHFDPVWLWRWDEAMASIRSTFRSALDRMNEDKDFVYSFCTPPVFEWIKKVDPKMFKEIKARIKEGRWELCEGWWVQPDCFSASGESYARQSLYGQRYLKQNFNKIAKTVFNVDSFGHAGAIPQILKKSQIDNYCMCRPENHHFEISSPYFYWQSKDGSKVKAFRVGQYSPIYHKDIPTVVAIAEENLKNADCDEMTMFGVTNHGGAPTKKALLDVHALNSQKDYTIKCAKVEEYFEAQGEPSVSIQGEMITKDFGPYVNGPEIKAKNRQSEYALLNAERANLIANKLINYPCEQDKISLLWQDVMFNQFHDILGGACIKDAYEDAFNGLGRATLSANEMVAYNLQAITKKIKMPGKNPDNAWNVVVWNLNGDEYDGYLEAEVQWLHEFDAYTGGIYLEDEFGEKIPCQIILEKSVITGFRSRFIFNAKIPAFGYRALKVVKTNQPIQKDYTFNGKIEKGNFVLSVKDGSITIFDKQTGVEYKNLISPIALQDDGDTWCFNVKGYGEKLEDFTLSNLAITEQGELMTKLRADYTFRKSTLSIYYTLYNNADYFDVNYKLNWQEKHAVLKLRLTAPTNAITVSSPFSSEEREFADIDKPMGEWINAKTDNGNISVVANKVFSYTANKDGLALSIARSCIYGDLRISELDQNADYPYMCQGETYGGLRVIVNGELESIANRGIEFNNPPCTIIEANHNGNLPSVQSLVKVSKNVILSALKRSEDMGGIVVRLYGISGKTEKASLSVFGKEFEFLVSPYEIKTLLIKGKKLKEILITEL